MATCGEGLRHEVCLFLRIAIDDDGRIATNPFRPGRHVRLAGKMVGACDVTPGVQFAGASISKDRATSPVKLQGLTQGDPHLCLWRHAGFTRWIDPGSGAVAE